MIDTCSEYCGIWLKENFDFDFNNRKYDEDYNENSKKSKDPKYAHKCLLEQGWKVVNDEPKKGDIIVILNNWLFVCVDGKNCESYVPRFEKARKGPVEKLLKVKHTVYRHPEIERKVNG